MENYTKIYPASISRLVDWENVWKTTKTLFNNLKPIGRPVFLTAVSVGLLLVVQVFAIGVSDRIGISPKISFLVSSLAYSAFFGGLAIVGGRKSGRHFESNFDAKPICKMLLIKRKAPETKI